MAERGDLNERQRNLIARILHKHRRFLIMFLYLWVIFGLFVLNQAVILAKPQITFSAEGFALINAFGLTKAMQIGERLKLGHRFDERPLVYPILIKACAFSVWFILFYIGKNVLAGVVRGKTVAESSPAIGGGTLAGALCVWAIMFISLIPFFAIREIGRVVGEDELWDLVFRRGAKVYKLQPMRQRPEEGVRSGTV